MISNIILMLRELFSIFHVKMEKNEPRIHETGIENETILGVGKQVKGVLMYVSGIYSPGENPRSRLSYLNKYDLTIKILKLPHDIDFAKKLGEKNYLSIQSNKEKMWNIKELYNMMVENEGKQNLIFRPNNWIIIGKQEEKHYLEGDIINVSDISVEYNIKFDRKGYDYMEVSESFDKTLIKVFIVWRAKDFIKDNMTLDNICETLKLNIDSCNQIYNTIKHISPGILKSLIQKMIRVSPRYIIHEALGKEALGKLHQSLKWKSKEVMLVSLYLLANHSGSLNPYSGIFTKGISALTKRLAVSIVEDSYGNSLDILMLLSISLISIDHDIFTNIYMLEYFYIIAKKAIYSLKSLRYGVDTSADTSIDNAIWDLNSYILEKLGSFKTDIQMFIDIADAKSYNKSLLKSSPKRERSMELVSCIDNHSYPNIMYYLPYHDHDHDITELPKIIWEVASKYNPRLKYTINIDTDITYEDILEAQALIWERLSL